MKYLLALTMMLVSADLFADYTIPGTGTFNSALGTLNKVRVRFKGDNISMTTPAHTHTITTTSVNYSYPTGSNPTTSLDFTVIAGPSGPVVTSSVGDHTHSFAPSFTWNGKNITLSPVTSSAGGAHSHAVTGLILFGDSNSGAGVANITGGTIGNGGAHTQTFSFDEEVEFTGSDLSMFLSPASPSLSYSGAFTVNGSNHTHIIASGQYTVQATDFMGTQTFQINLLNNILLSNSSTGDHIINLGGNVFETTFEFTPFSAVPEPSSFILFSVVAGAGAIGRRFWKKRKATC